MLIIYWTLPISIQIADVADLQGRRSYLHVQRRSVCILVQYLGSVGGDSLNESIVGGRGDLESRGASDLTRIWTVGREPRACALV